MGTSLRPARFTDIVAGVFERDDRRYLAYQNTALSLNPALAGCPSSGTGSSNALILPIPDVLSNIEVIDTRSCPHFLNDIQSALTPLCGQPNGCAMGGGRRQIGRAHV